MPKLDFTKNNFEMKVGDKKVIGVKLGEKTLYELNTKREIALGDILTNKTISIEYPSQPIQITDTSECYYSKIRLESSDGTYRISEGAFYDIQNSTDTYTDWVFTFSLQVYKGNELADTLYQCNTKVRITYDNNGNVTGKTIQSTTESIKKTSYTLESSFDWMAYGEPSNKDVIIYTDIFTQKKDYALEPLEYTDDLKNLYTLVFNIPKDFEGKIFPHGKPNISYYNYLFFVEKNTEESFYSTGISLFSDYDYDNNGNKIETQTWGVQVTWGAGDANSTLVLKTFGKNIYTQFNSYVSIGGWDISAPLTTLNKKNPLYPYVKKVVWK